MLNKENSQAQYERDQLMGALTVLRKKVQEKVPVISFVEDRRLELESSNRRAKEDVRTI